MFNYHRPEEKEGAIPAKSGSFVSAVTKAEMSRYFTSFALMGLLV